MMLTAFWIGLWAWLFCRPLSDEGEVFGWVRDLVYVHVVVRSRLSERASEMAYKVLIDCPKCHAGQIALWWQVVACLRGDGFSIPFILVAVFVAICFEDFAGIVQKMKYGQ